MKHLLHILFFLPVLFYLNSCANYRLNYAPEAEAWQQQAPEKDLKLKHRIYLVGDAGLLGKKEDSPVLDYLSKKLKKESKKSTILFLGNNVPSKGYSAKKNKQREHAQKALDKQMDILKDFKGTPVFLPGATDWAGGLKSLRKEGKYVEKQLNKDSEEGEEKNYFRPDRGCPGPEIVEVNEQLSIVLMDSEWWMIDWDKEPEIHEGCEVKNKFMFKFLFEDEVRGNRSKNVVIAMHHPLYTNGPHSGNFSAKTHLFPLTELNKNLFIPLPILGSMYAFFRGRIGTKQDIAHQEYRNLRDALLTGVKKNGNFIFVSGHEHNLQYLENEEQHFIVSGSAARKSPSTIGRGAQFAYGAYGFATLDFYKDGSAWVHYWATNKDGTDAEEVFRKKIKDKLSIIKENIPTDFPEYDQKLTAIKRLPTRNEISKAGAFQRWLLGEHYRSLYLTEFEFPVIDLDTFMGGLTPIKRGGGNQTNSLRLKDKEGHQYVLRDLTKDVTRLLPFPFNKMRLAEFIGTDNFLSTHPFAPVVIPPMAEAINIYHTNPRFVYVPKQPRLGVNNDIFGGSVYLFEERPGGSWEGMQQFGGSDALKSTPDVAARLINNHKHQIDQEWTLRTRLFDFILGDWDRHDDQWRWARFKPQKGKNVYRPVPRDRDQAFSKYDGLLTRMVTFTMPFLHQLAVYQPKIKQIKWAAWSPRSFDNSFINELDWSQWEAQVSYIQQHLTDDIVDKAFEIWPDAVYNDSGDYIKNTLKHRRDELPNIARRYYEFLSKEVDVYGTDKKELFEVDRLSDEQTRVRMYDTNKEGERQHLLYDRTFDNKVTKEIHLYGIGNDDHFLIKGQTRKGIKIRCIGGQGDDQFVDQSKVAGLCKKTVIYDDKRNNKVQGGSETSDRRSHEVIKNIYDRRAAHYDYDFVLPFPILGSNPDDGFVVGANLLFTDYEFKKDPYNATHNVIATFASSTKAFSLEYTGDFLNVFGKTDFYLHSIFKNPSYAFNYFGFGNDSQRGEEGIEFFRARQGLAHVNPALKWRLAGNNGFFNIGPVFELSKIDRLADRYLLSDRADVPPDVFDTKYFGGLKLGFNYYNVDDKVIPRRGISFLTDAGYLANLKDKGSDFGSLRSELAVYQNIDRKQNLILATRLGFGYNSGNQFEFWQAPSLGGKTSLRGYRAQRFYGKTAFWQNIDLRLRLFSSYNRALPFTFGIYAGYDYGRVWLERDDSDTWHSNYGGGIWLAPLDAVVLSFGLFMPHNPLDEEEEKQRFAFTAGFNF